jgi:hypothetical protein
MHSVDCIEGNSKSGVKFWTRIRGVGGGGWAERGRGGVDIFYTDKIQCGKETKKK